MKTSNLDTLYKQRKDGKIQVCDITISQEKEGEVAKITTVHGIEDGKKQTDVNDVTKGKNIGKKNETSIWDQACSDAQSKWNKKKDSGYYTTKEESKSPDFRPMLAYEYGKRIKSVFRAHKKENLFFVQPKLDGVRGTAMLVNGEPKMFTRKGKDVSVTVPHILKSLGQNLTENMVLDGEIYSLDENYNIQSIAGAVNKKEFIASRHTPLCFIVYDVYYSEEPTLSYQERYIDRNWKDLTIGDTVFSIYRYSFSWEVCQSFTASKAEDLEPHLIKQHNSATDLGFEGIMVRSNDYPYTVGKRTPGLLKRKQFFDAEYEIIDITTPETGREKGTAIFICKTKDSTGEEVTFNAPSCGTREQRQALYEDRENLIGKQVTVQYQDLTDLLVPRFPKAIAVRDYE